MIPARMNTVSVVLVTNVGQGFGRAVALAYGQANYDVVCADRDVDLASKTAAEIEELGGQAIPIQTSMTTSAEVRKAFDKVFEIFGDLSGVVHVTNFDSRTSFERLSEGELSELLEETIYSTLVTLKAASRYLEHAWIVLIGPPLNAREPQMAAVQGALEHVTQRYRDTSNDVTINLVVPSRIASDPFHDAPLVENVMYLGATNKGVNGQRVIVKLPPPPRVIESLLPEVRAALDDSMGQEELEASVFVGAASVLDGASSQAAITLDQDDADQDTSAYEDDADSDFDVLDDDADDDDVLDDFDDSDFDDDDLGDIDLDDADFDDDDSDLDADDYPSSPYAEHYADAPLEADADDALYLANSLTPPTEDDGVTTDDDDDADISYYGDYDYYNDYNELAQDDMNSATSTSHTSYEDNLNDDADDGTDDNIADDLADGADSDTDDTLTTNYPHNLKRQVRN
ncbi:MAG: SDR family NAD(P)-dependent oxidoreductase [Deinococcota bacterium]